MLTAPDFKPDIPAYLLDKCSESERYLIETMNVLNKKTDWQTTKMEKQAQRLIEGKVVMEQILAQARLTNGRVSKAETDISSLQTESARVKKDIEMLDTVLGWMKTKWFWITVLSAAAIFFLGALPWVYSNHITLHKLVELIVKFAA